MNRFKRLKVSIPVTLLIILLSFTYAIAAIHPDEQQFMLDNATQKAVMKAVDSLQDIPDRVTTLALVGLDKDPEHKVGDFLITSLTKSRFRIIERSKLEEILKEHKYNLDHYGMLESDTVKELGHILAVDAIIFGEVLESRVLDNFVRVRVRLQMDDITNGEVIWSETVTGEEHLAPIEKARQYYWLIPTIIVIALVVLIFLLISRKPRKYATQQKHLKADQTIRNTLSDELKKASNSLKEISAKAYDRNLTDIVTATKEVSLAADLLAKEINHAEFGQSPYFDQAKINTATLNRVKDFDTSLLTDLTTLTKQIETIYQAIVSGQIQSTVGQLNQLKVDIDKVRNKFGARRELLLGMR